jgi:tetratricopeptide (TPR) repeat protein
LLTASPVPIMRTFTGDDVIIANTYSKSVLRAVAGQIAEEYPNVDYLPGYEAVMLTKQANVWSDDLRHVEPEFVGRLVGRMCARYVVETEGRTKTDQYEQALSIASLVKLGRFDDARAVFDSLTLADVRISHPASVQAVAEMFLHFGEHEKAYATAMRLRTGALGYGEEACVIVLGCAKIFDALGKTDEAAETRALAVERLKKPALVKALVRKSVTAGELATARLIMDHIEHYLAGDLDLLNFAAQTSYAIEDFDSAERICRAALEVEPGNPEMLARLGYILCRRERDEEAIGVLQRALAIAPTNTRILESLVPACLRQKRLDDVEQHARMLISLSPSHAAGYSWLASALKRSGRRSEALDAARRAVELDPGNERYSRYADELAGDIARRNDESVGNARVTGSRGSTTI